MLPLHLYLTSAGTKQFQTMITSADNQLFHTDRIIIILTLESGAVCSKPSLYRLNLKCFWKHKESFTWILPIVRHWGMPVIKSEYLLLGWLTLRGNFLTSSPSFFGSSIWWFNTILQKKTTKNPSIWNLSQAHWTSHLELYIFKSIRVDK